MNETSTKQRHLNMLSTAFGQHIMDLIDNADVIEIMLNPDGKLWAESFEKGQFFTDIILKPEQTINIIKLIAASRHEIVDSEHPQVSCELPESGARFQGLIPPIVAAPTFAIRKKAIRVFTLDDYVKAGSITEKAAAWLKNAVLEHKNILIAGGTASGKTTFANALLHELNTTKDRVIILEDLPELQVNIENHIKLRTSNEISMRNLVQMSLRLRPDRIIIGEVRDGAAIELLKSWNTGHPGGICTIHANSPEATLARLADLIQEAVSVVPQRLIAEAINVIVFMQRDKQGKHKIASIHEYQCDQTGDYFLQLIN